MGDLTLNSKTTAELAELRGNGLSLLDCARAAGVGRRSLMSWLSQGREDHIDGVPDTMQGRLVTAMEEAQAARKAVLLANVRRHASEPIVTVRETVKGDGEVIVTTETKPPDVRSAMWLLERLDPDEFAQVQRVEQGRPGEFKAVSTEEAIEKLERLLGVKLAPALEAPDAGASDD